MTEHVSLPQLAFMRSVGQAVHDALVKIKAWYPFKIEVVRMDFVDVSVFGDRVPDTTPINIRFSSIEDIITTKTMDYGVRDATNECYGKLYDLCDHYRTSQEEAITDIICRVLDGKIEVEVSFGSFDVFDVNEIKTYEFATGVCYEREDGKRFTEACGNQVRRQGECYISNVPEPVYATVFDHATSSVKGHVR